MFQDEVCVVYFRMRLLTMCSIFQDEVIPDSFTDIGDLLIKEDVDILKYLSWDNEVMIIVLNLSILKNYNFDPVIIWQKDSTQDQ